MQNTFHKTGLKEISSVVDDSSGPVVVQEYSRIVQEYPRSFLYRTREEKPYKVTPLEQFQEKKKEFKK